MSQSLLFVGSASTITNSNNLAITSQISNVSRNKEAERNLDGLKW